MRIKLEKPRLFHKEKYLEYIEEWESNGEVLIPESSQVGENTYETWLQQLEMFSSRATCPLGYVPADTFFAVNCNGDIVGVINIRHELNEYLEDTGGHIGYGVRPGYRCKGYAKEMMQLIKEYAKNELSLSKLLVTCIQSNSISAKTIIASGGVLEDERFDQYDGELTQRYWISI